MQRNQQIVIRLREEDIATLDKLAEYYGLPRSGVIKVLLREKAKQILK